MIRSYPDPDEKLDSPAETEIRTVAVRAGEGSVDVRVRVGGGHSNQLRFGPSYGEFSAYDTDSYEVMATDTVRNELYRAALSVQAQGRVVLDLGTGERALWAIAAARAGARKVYAVEVMPAAAESARAAVAASGFADRVTVCEGMSTTLELPEPVDLCVSEVIGTIGGSEGVAAVLRDVSDRLLGPGGRHIPDRCATWVAAACLDELLPDGEIVFEARWLPYLERMFAEVGHPFDVRLCAQGPVERALVSTVAEVEPLRFNDVRFNGENALDGVDEVELTVNRPTRVHGFFLGIRLWAAASLPPLDSLTQECCFFPAYAPVSREGVAVEAGDRIRLSFRRTPSSDGVHPDYAIAARLRPGSSNEVALDWKSPHHAPVFRSTEVYRAIFP